MPIPPMPTRWYEAPGFAALFTAWLVRFSRFDDPCRHENFDAAHDRAADIGRRQATRRRRAFRPAAPAASIASSVHHKRSPSSSASVSTTAAPRSAKTRRVRHLVIVGAMRIRHENRRRAGRRQLGQRRGAGASDRDVGRRVCVGRIGEVRDEHDVVVPDVAFFGLHVCVIALAADVQHLPVRRPACGASRAPPRPR